MAPVAGDPTDPNQDIGDPGGSGPDDSDTDTGGGGQDADDPSDAPSADPGWGDSDPGDIDPPDDGGSGDDDSGNNNGGGNTGPDTGDVTSTYTYQGEEIEVLHSSEDSSDHLNIVGYGDYWTSQSGIQSIISNTETLGDSANDSGPDEDPSEAPSADPGYGSGGPNDDTEGAVETWVFQGQEVPVLETSPGSYRVDVPGVGKTWVGGRGAVRTLLGIDDSSDSGDDPSEAPSADPGYGTGGPGDEPGDGSDGPGVIETWVLQGQEVHILEESESQGYLADIPGYGEQWVDSRSVVEQILGVSSGDDSESPNTNEGVLTILGDNAGAIGAVAGAITIGGFALSRVNK